MSKLALIAAVLVAGYASMACNTVQGVGKDIERGGEAIQRAVK
ncbi:MAG TPA: entericidin A/B family lipoprotein [Thauera sp.]|jgi:entericidin B|nr:entericidin A/B family lipoprotein [Thauera sp.]HRA80272.1 entericidin A/B family lipoprotein [Thauera sp.]